jgi:4-hydroxysphinganine ceramide fatty acyl 2-hydroxylase
VHHVCCCGVASQTVWWVVPLVWLPVTLAMLYFGGADMTSSAVAAHFIAGVVYWTLLEYSLHRFLFHVDEWLPESPNGLTAHFLMHGCHHKVPNDRYRLVMPPVATLVLYLSVGALSRLLLLPLVPAFGAFVVVYAGVVFGYVCYDMVHYSTHHGNFNPKSYLGLRRKYHLRHHYNNQYNIGFGITSALWDKVFHTLLPLED